MRLLARTFLVTLLISSLLCGCSTERAAYRTIGTAAQLVDLSLNSYYQYRETHFDKGLDDRIQTAYRHYQDVAKVARDAEISFKAGSLDKNVWQTSLDAFAASAMDLVNLIKNFLPPETVKQLKI